MVGVAGDTGMGKTTLLNTLMSSTEDVAPSSQNKACTAAVTCFHYHNPEPGKEFCADIQIKPKDTVDQEVESYFQDLHDFEERTKLDGADNVVSGERERLEEQLKIIQSWSGLAVEDIRGFGVQGSFAQITTRCVNGAKLFKYASTDQGIIIRIEAHKANEFRKKIKPYIGSIRTQTQLWPLVEVAHIYLKEDILRDGIVLVDLPGEQDATESRTQAGKPWHCKVDRLMIVAPYDRASDNRTAADLIRQDHVVDLEADGKLDQSDVCIVTTKFDELKWHNFVAEETKAEDISEDFPAWMDRYGENEDALAEVDEEILAIKEELAGLQLELDDDEDKEPLMKTEAKLNALRNRRQIFETKKSKLDAHCRGACIKACTREHTAVFQKRFNAIRNDMRKKNSPRASTTIQVFPVSSDAYRQLNSDEGAKLGFPDPKSTGIPALRDSIVLASLPKREEHIDLMLGRCLGLFDAGEGWATNALHIRLKLPESELKNIQAFLAVEKRFFKLVSRSCNSHLLTPKWNAQVLIMFSVCRYRGKIWPVWSDVKAQIPA